MRQGLHPAVSQVLLFSCATMDEFSENKKLPYEYMRQSMQAQLAGHKARLAMMIPDFNPESEECIELLNKDLIGHVIEMALSILVRLDVIDDPRNDSSKTIARELVEELCKRLSIDPETHFGIK